MKESMWGYWLALLGIIVSSVMILLQNYTTTDQQDYYLAREITYASMYDAIDFGYYKKTGDLKIVKEKFVENFVRRFAQNVTLNKGYTINFYSIYEMPPAVSVEIKTNTGEHLVGEELVNANVTTRLTAILEIKDKVIIDSTFMDNNVSSNVMLNNGIDEGVIEKEVYSATYVKKADTYHVEVSHELEVPTKDDLRDFIGTRDFSKYKITLEKLNYVSNLTTNDDLMLYDSRYDNTFVEERPTSACLYPKCNSYNYGAVSNDVIFSKTGNRVTWKSWIKNQCSDSMMFDDGIERCGYGIKYIAQWKYEYIE